MAKNLVWRDLSAEQLENIRHPHPKKGLTSRDLLARFLGITDQHKPRNEISLDLFVHTLQFGQELKFADDKLSGLFSIVKEVHQRSTEEKLEIERSFKMFKDMLLAHSVQRPPYSIGLFTFPEMKRIIEWFMDSYYRHYKLYMYAFTDRVLMNVTQRHPLDEVELPPLPLQPLNDALTEEQHDKVLEEEAAKRAEEEAEAAAAQAAEDEAARQARLREEYEASIPEEVKEKVKAALERELGLLKTRMEEQFQAQQAELQARIEVLEAKVPK